MALAAGAIAGIAVGCAIVSFVVGLLIGPLRRRLSRPEVLMPHLPTPMKIAREIDELAHLDHSMANGEPLNIEEQMDTLHCWIYSFVIQFFWGGDRFLYDIPFDPEKLTRLAGGDHGEDWSALANFDPCDQRLDIIQHFIARVLWLRMIPDGDLSITLLPTDMLSVWQRFSTKEIPAGGWCNDFTKQTEPVNTMLRQYWRFMTVLWGADRYRRLQPQPFERCFFPGDPYVQRKGAWGIGLPDGATVYKERIMLEDDPRMASVIATEEALKDALAPLCRHRHDFSQPDGKQGFEALEAQQLLRQITTRAADIALIAFSRPEPYEFYWPEETVRPGVPSRYEPEAEAEPGHLIQFGVRHRTIVLGCEEDARRRYANGEMEERNYHKIKTVHDARPRYGDSSDVRRHWDDYGYGLWAVQAEVERRREKGEHVEVTEEEEQRKKYLEMMRNSSMGYYRLVIEPWETDGWEPAHWW